MPETTALGAAMAAGKACGIWSLDHGDLTSVTFERFEPTTFDEREFFVQMQCAHGRLDNLSACYIHALTLALKYPDGMLSLERIFVECKVTSFVSGRFQKWKLAVQKSMGWHYGDNLESHQTEAGNARNNYSPVNQAQILPGTFFIISTISVAILGRINF